MSIERAGGGGGGMRGGHYMNEYINTYDTRRSVVGVSTNRYGRALD